MELFTNSGNVPAKQDCVTTVSSTQTESNTTAESTAVADTTDRAQVPINKGNVNRQEDQRPICFRYKQGKCPHGKSGNRIVNGQKCNFVHPRKCIKHCRFGQDKDQGCNGPCEFFHPILCRNSLRYRKCYSETCTFAHLSGTERYENQLPPSHNLYNQSNFRQHDFDSQNQYRPEPRNVSTYQNSKYSSYVRPSFQRSRDEGFRYKNSDFPPLTASQPDRMDEMSSSIKQMQKCIEYIMQNLSTSGQYPSTNNILQPGINQSHQIYNNIPQSMFNNHSVPQPMPNNQPQAVFYNHQMEAKK